MSSLPRFFIAIPLSIGQEILLEDEVCHRLKHVLRCRVGAAIAFFNGQESGEYAGNIIALSPRKLTVKLTHFTPLQTESCLKVHLFQGISKGERMDAVMQKATELGVNAITPVIMERTVVRLSTERWARKVTHWQRIALFAAEQSGRCNIPTVHPPVKLEACSALAEKTQRFFCAPSGKSQVLAECQVAHTGVDAEQRMPDKTASASLLVGPEGGISATEFTYLIEKGCQPLSLGPRILRTETAPIVALGLLQHYLGDLQ